MNMTKKVGSSGRFGSRYGKGVRDRVVAIEKVSKKVYECPSCHKMGLVRVASGIWVCKKCGKKYAGKAFKPPLKTRDGDVRV
ncbi:MAG: 50S ribosomal protein L37ae [Candidatus Aenigmarchaeota archaeon]|nr:50S ribosomal protein L37ae [Candidatus Aenigmarchaeota archaeon]